MTSTVTSVVTSGTTMNHISSYVYKHTNGVYYFRKAIPRHMRRELNAKPDVRISLRTRDYKSALALARRYVVKIDQILAKDDVMDVFKKKSIKDLVNKLDFVVTTAEGHKIELNNVKAGEEEAAKELLEKSLNMLEKREKTEVKKKEEKNIVTIEDALKEFMTKSIESTKWSANNRAYYATRLSIFNKIIGKIKINDFNENDYVHALKELSFMPTRQNKTEYKGKDILQIISENKANKNAELITDETFNKYVTCLSVFFDWANSKGYSNCNFIKKGMRKLTESSREKRDAFTKVQIKMILKLLELNKERFREKWQYFIPLIAIYSGARQAEIAQLDTCDIKQENGIWGFEISESQHSDKSVKNRSSVRFVPLHSEILKAGFLEFCEERRAKKYEKLFFNERRDYGDTVNKWFNRTFLEKLNFDNRNKLAFHSFRHTFITEIMNSENNNDRLKIILMHIVGHAQETTTTNTYLKHISAENKLKVIEILRFD